MLTHLSIRDYTIVEHLEMEFRAGMTVITGETGAGKSIMLGALGLCLGDRADPDSVRAGAERSEISATFHPCEPARLWLRERDMEAGEECILRRSMQREGRSRAFINGRACTLQDCAHLGELLIDIHGQHAHHSLLRREVQRGQLDEFAGQSGAVSQLQQIAADWSSLRRKLEELSGSGSERNARAQLLSYQVEELDSLDLQAGLVEALEAEQKQLANAERILHTVQQALELSEQHESGARQLLRLVQEDFLQGEAINSIRELVDSAAIQLGESGLELQHLLDRVEVNPDQLRAVEGRLETLYSVARKHRVRAELLPETRQRLKRELDDLRAGDAHVEALQGQLGELAANYRTAAGMLSKARASAAQALTREVMKQLAGLAMQQCRFEIVLSPRGHQQPNPQGLEDVEFRIAANPGQTPGPLGKIASGGELSRISLAIQVAAATAGAAPSMVFDEVDLGIGGAVAEVVGRLLLTLSARAQVLCVTHLPQVASQGHQHLRVVKTSDHKRASVDLQQLSGDERVNEIARMLGGIEITRQTLAHAREMISEVSRRN